MRVRMTKNLPVPQSLMQSLTVENSLNFPIPLPFGALSGMPQPVEAKLLGLPKSLHEALLLSWKMRRRKVSQSEAANELGIHAPVFSNILRGKRHLPHDKWAAFMEITGNLLPLQFLAHELGKTVQHCELAAARWVIRKVA